MARILFSAYSNIIWVEWRAIDPFYQGFLSSLKEAGNDVLFIRTNDFIDQFDCAQWHFAVKKNILLEEVRRFDPEIIITANNSLPYEILRETTCPVLVYTADAPAHFASPEKIRKNIGRYAFIHGWDRTLGEVCVNHFHCKPEQNIYAGYFTAIRAETRPVRNNIVFIGFLGWPQEGRKKFKALKTRKELEQLLSDFEQKTRNSEQWDFRFLHMLTFSERVRTLDAIWDLGLRVYGNPDNIMEATPFSMGTARSFDFTPVFTLEKTQEVLNESKIAPTLYNAQAPGGVSWRVPDVMASNACLISTPKNDLKRISPYIEIPTYASPSECRELCRKLLSDEPWRRAVVEGSQKAVDEQCRFVHLLRMLEDRYGISLVKRREGSVVWAEQPLRQAVLRGMAAGMKKTPAYKVFQKTAVFKVLKKMYRSIRPYDRGAN
jgi:hypothetical protein